MNGKVKWNMKNHVKMDYQPQIFSIITALNQ